MTFMALVSIFISLVLPFANQRFLAKKEILYIIAVLP